MESSGFLPPSQGEGGEEVLLARRALVGRRWAEIRLPVGADVVVVVVVVMQGVQQRGRGALASGPHRNDVRAGTQRPPAVFLLSSWSLTSSRCAEPWAGSAAARSPPVARPVLSAASSWRAPAGQSPLLLRPSAASRPSGAGSASWTINNAGYKRSQTKKDILEFKFTSSKLRMNVYTWSFWSSKELCSSSPCITISFTFLSSLRLASCRLARSLLTAWHAFIISIIIINSSSLDLW